MTEDLVQIDADVPAGELIGEYKVVRKLGEGGFGAVYRAAHPVIGKEVAIKVLHRRFSADPQIVSRFAAEARAVNQIRHRNIIDIFAFGKLADGRHYYVMELLTGTPLDALLKDQGRVEPVQAIAILRGVGRALDAAHRHGIVHRDLKPANIFLADTPEGVSPRLLDFGGAKLLAEESPSDHRTETGVRVGTPHYMSPEQCRGRNVDHRTDIYAFGVLSYRLFTGSLPFLGADAMDVVIQHLQKPPPRASDAEKSLPPGLDSPILWMMQKEPNERPPNLASAVAALEEAGRDAGLAIPVSAPAPDDAPVLAKPPAGRGESTRLEKRELEVANTTLASSAGERSGAHAARSAGPTLITVLVGALALVGVGGFLLLRKPPAPAAPAPTEASAPTPPSVPAVASSPDAVGAAVEQPPPKPTTVKVTIEGTRGAEIVGEHGLVYGTIPFTLELERADAPIRVVIRKNGYVTRSLEVPRLADGRLEVLLPKKSRPTQTGSSPEEKPLDIDRDL